MATFPRNTAETKPALLATPTAIPVFDFSLVFFAPAVSESSLDCMRVKALNLVILLLESQGNEYLTHL